MKAIHIKQAVIAWLLIAGLTLFSSCNSCNDNKDNQDTTGTAVMTEGDTIDTSADAGSGYDGEYGTGTSINRSTGTSGGNTQGTGSGTTSTAGNTGSGTSNNNGTSTSAYDPNNDPIENTSRPARNSKGEPIVSGGSSGSGQGTGTGSTGNNSRVRTAEEQRD